jgi:acyl-CoA thioesterase-1
VTRIVAFGDSITEGLTIGRTLLLTSPSASYPFKLEAMLRARYLAQTHDVLVLDEGVGGEHTPDGLTRLPGVLAADNPQVVLLMEGANDLNFSGSESAIPNVVANLGRMIDMIQARGAVVMIATLSPQRKGGDHAANPSVVPVANLQIQAMAAGKGAMLVDVYGGFGGSPDPWIGADGLHPTEMGQERIASLFFDALRARFETAAP